MIDRGGILRFPTSPGGARGDRLPYSVTMKTFVISALLFLSTTAGGSPFSAPVPKQNGPEEIDLPERAQLGDITAVAMDCSITMRFNLTMPTGGEMMFVGRGCEDTEEDAMAAARLHLSAKALPTVGGEPARPPVYDCSTQLLWDTSAPTLAHLATTGGPVCEAALPNFLRYMAQALACAHHFNTPCRPPF